MYFCVDFSKVGGLVNGSLQFSGGAWLLYDDGPPPRRMEAPLVLGDVKIRMNEGNEGISGRIRELITINGYHNLGRLPGPELPHTYC